MATLLDQSATLESVIPLGESSIVPEGLERLAYYSARDSERQLSIMVKEMVAKIRDRNAQSKKNDAKGA